MTDGNFSQNLLRGSLDLMTLSVLSTGAKYGYLIQKELRIISGGQVELKAGTLYPLLHRLENRKWIRSRWDDSTGRRRKWYELTPQGHRAVARQAEQWTRHAQWVQQLIAPLIAEPKPS
jgi:PadR family transcriptional regulator PadR